ncbi:hypothetical protein [Bradyrhizobium barranii]
MVITEGRIIVAASMRWARGQDDGILDRFWLDQAAGAGGGIHFGLGSDGLGADHSALLGGCA